MKICSVSLRGIYSKQRGTVETVQRWKQTGWVTSDENDSVSWGIAVSDLLLGVLHSVKSLLCPLTPRSLSPYIKFSLPHLIPYACDCFTLFFRLHNPKGKCLPSYNKKTSCTNDFLLRIINSIHFALPWSAIYKTFIFLFYLPVTSFSDCFDFFNCRLSWICASAYFIWIFRINCNVMCFVFQFT